MTIGEVKKYLYKNNPVAVFQYILKGVAVYETTVYETLENPTTGKETPYPVVITFSVPVDDMGDAKFENTMDSKYMNRWILEIIENTTD